MWVKDSLHIMWRWPSPSVPSSSLLCSPLCPSKKKGEKKHPLFEGCDGKSERLKQSASKLACKKALNQYPQLSTTQPCSSLTPTSPRPATPSDPAVPPKLLRLFPPSSPSITSCTRAHAPSWSPPGLFCSAAFLSPTPAVPVVVK